MAPAGDVLYAPLLNASSARHSSLLLGYRFIDRYSVHEVQTYDGNVFGRSCDTSKPDTYVLTNRDDDLTINSSRESVIGI